MQTIYLDISNKGVIPCIQAKQGEVGRKFLAVITDNGVPYNITDSSILSVWYEGESGKGNYTEIGEKEAISVYKNKITVELIEQMLSVPGTGIITVLINSVSGDQIGLWNIDYSVEKTAGVESEKAEEYYTAFSEAAANLAKSAEEINSVIKAKNATAAGLIYPLASSNVPSGFLLCDGAEYSRTDYPELFEAIGTIYGRGDGKTTFNVPNLSKRVPVGAGDKYELGATGGEETHQLTVEEMPSHKHGFSVSTTDGYGSTSAQVAEGDGKNWSSGYNGETNSTGGGQPHNNMQPYTVVNYIISTGKEVEFVVGGTGIGGGDISVIDDTIVSTEKTWSSQKIADEISNIPSGGGGGDSPVIITSFGDYTNLAEYIKNGMEDNSAVICYTDKKLTEGFPDTSAISYSAMLTWCIEIHKSTSGTSSVAEINARASNKYSAMQTTTHRWNGMYNGYSIDWKQIELYTGAEPGSGGTDSVDSIVAQGTSNGWAWRKWSNGFAECWKTVSCSTISGNVAYTTETLPVEIKTNRTILATQSDISFGVPTTEITKFTSAFAPGVSNPIRIFAQKTENFATGSYVSASVYVCGNYQ